MKQFVKSLVLVVVVLMVSALALPTLADDNFKGVIIPSDAVLYHTDGILDILKPDADGNWYSALSLTDDQLAQVALTPSADTLVTQEGDLALYKLTSGEWQINNGPDVEGKTHVIVFDAGWGSYHAYDMTTSSSLTVTSA